MSYLGGAKVQSAKIQMQSMATAMDLFLLDMGRYPTAEEGVAALIEPAGEDAKNWKGPYLDKMSAVIDPWCAQYRFRRPGREGPFDISSTRADKEAGGEGDADDLFAGGGPYQATHPAPARRCNPARTARRKGHRG